MRVLGLALILQVALCLLKITTPVVNQLHNNQIPYSLANFGDIPYGVTLKGYLRMDQQYPDLCSPIKPLNDSNTILLAWRGDCSFVKKVLNGQRAGAKMVIISDNIVEDSSHITMGDNGSGRNVHIPSAFINETNGEILQRQLQHSSVSLSMRFDIKQADRVNVTLFLSLRDRHSAVFVREIHPFVQLFGDSINLDVSYYTAACGGCDLVECFATNDYCIITGNRTGGAIINNQILQYGIFLLDKHKWFQVYDQYDQRCYGTAALNCLQEIMKEQKVDQKQIQTAYSKKGYPLQQWRTKTSLMGVTSYPSVSVNGIKYMGSIDSEDVVEMICASLNNPPEGPCSQFGYWTYSSNNGNNFAVALWVTMIVLVVILMIVGGVFVYRKTVKKQITNEMSLKVTQIVTQYIKLSSDQERQSRNKEIQKSREDL